MEAAPTEGRSNKLRLPGSCSHPCERPADARSRSPDLRSLQELAVERSTSGVTTAQGMNFADASFILGYEALLASGQQRAEQEHLKIDQALGLTIFLG